MMRAAPVLLTVGALLAFGAPALANGCSHVSAADVGKAIGTPIATSTVQDHPGSEGCSYKAAAGIPFVTVNTSPADTATFVMNVGASAKMFDAKPVSVPGIGDAAMIVTHVLWFHKGGRLYTINAVVQGGPAKQIAVEKAIAKKIR
jgi:hypothetical protein